MDCMLKDTMQNNKIPTLVQHAECTPLNPTIMAQSPTDVCSVFDTRWICKDLQADFPISLEEVPMPTDVPKVDLFKNDDEDCKPKEKEAKRTQSWIETCKAEDRPLRSLTFREWSTFREDFPR